MIEIGSVWDRTTEFLSDNMAAVVPLALAAIFIPLCIWSSVAPLAMNASSGQKIAIYVGLLLLSLWQMWGKVAITALALEPEGGRAMASGTATRRMVSAIIVSLVLLVACVVLVLPVVIAMAASGLDFQAMAAGGHPKMPGGGVLALAFLYVPVALAVLLVIAPRLALIWAVVVAEKQTVCAIPRSFRLTQGIWLKLIGVLLLYVVVSQVSILATKLIFGILFRLVFGDDGGVSIASVLTAILVSVVATVFTVLAAAFLAKLYNALRAVREGAAASL